MREGVDEVAIAVDCSGSVSGRQLRLFEAEVRSILERQQICPETSCRGNGSASNKHRDRRSE